jgi:general secretion pathway protein E
MQYLARYWKLPFVKIDPLKLDLEVVTSYISEPFARRHIVVPITITSDEAILTIATVDPWDVETLENIQRVTGMKLELVISTKSEIHKIIKEFFGFKLSVKAAETELTRRVDIANLEQFTEVGTHLTDRHIINAVNLLFNYAFEQRASDIHIEPKRKHSQIRLRIDGVLHNVYQMPKAVHAAFVSRIKTLSRMDIAEKRRPQDGRIKTKHQDKYIELRVSTLPVAFDEKVVIRILDPDMLIQKVENLGFPPEDAEKYLSFLDYPHGIVLLTGPTGSGKTTTLYSSLAKLSSSEINIVTIEDPIEMIYEEFNQVAVQPGVGITFDSCLRNILRQDPDVIMVGEIRDRETAENAIHSALTGHLVFSTLHTNDAPSAITRLVDMGIESFLIESSLIGVVAQRLVRRICPHCEKVYIPHAKEIAPLSSEINIKEYGSGPLQLKRGIGCVSCRGTGHLGRIGIFEIMVINEKIRELIRNRASSEAVKKQAIQDGMKTLRKSAIQKMLEGNTSLEEIIRVTGVH